MRILFIFLLITTSTIRASDWYPIKIPLATQYDPDLWNKNYMGLWDDAYGRDLRDSERKDAFLQAICGCNLERAKELFAKHPDLVNQKFVQTQGILRWVTAEIIFKKIKESGSELACFRKGLSVIRKAFVPVSGTFETTPLHEAAYTGYVEMVKFLLDSGADINVTNNCYRSALHYAGLGGHEKVMELLKARGAQSFRDNCSQTPEDALKSFIYKNSRADSEIVQEDKQQMD